MFRLTLRSRDDGRFLARVIERDGFAFVLDYGDPATVADASEKVARGFSVMVDGNIQQVPASSKELLPRLADYYTQQGLLVKLEEQNLRSMAPSPSPYVNSDMAPEPLSTALESPRTNNEDADEPTELVPIDVPIGEQVTLIRKGLQIPAASDEDTVRLDGPVIQRKMWEPGEDGGPAMPPKDPNSDTLSEYMDLVAKPKPEPGSDEWKGGDEEETELVPLELRRKVIRGEDLTEAHSDAEALMARLDEGEKAPESD